MKKREIIRKTAIGAMAFLFAGIIIMSLTQMAPGEYQIAGDFITVDPKAHGTKLPGTVCIYYETDCNSIPVSKYFFIRLQKDKNLYPFSGIFPSGINMDDTTAQEATIVEFFGEKIFPELFPNPPKSFALKSYSQLIQGGLCDNGLNPYFAMFDFVVAVKE